MIRHSCRVCLLAAILFLATVATHSGPLFRGVQNCPAPNDTRLAAPADFNGDAIPDLAFGVLGSSVVHVYLNDGDGFYLEGDQVIVSGTTVGLASGDFDGDGHQDLAVNCRGENYNILQLCYGSGDGSFELDPFPSYAGLWSSSVAVGDAQADGDLDLAVADFWSDHVLVYLNDGTGFFEAPANYPAGSNPGVPAFGDVNGDGLPDLAVAGGSFEEEVGQPPEYWGQVALLLGTANGTFTATGLLHEGCIRSHVLIRDLDQDGHGDLVVCSSWGCSRKVLVSYGHGDGTFESPLVIELGHRLGQADIVDLDQDGQLDLLAAGDGGVSLLVNDGDREFEAMALMADGLECRPVAATDANGDGRPDFLLGHGGGVSVYLQGPDGDYLEAPAQPGFALDMAHGDLNGDGFPDLVCVYNDLEAYLNPGDGTLGQAETTELTVEHGAVIDLGDVDGDGDLDAVGAGLNHIFVARGDGEGGFGPVEWYEALAGLGPQTMLLEDFNGDLALDLALGHGTGTGFIFLNTGDGIFQPHEELSCGYFIMSLASGDLDLDGHLDLVAACMREETVRVFLGQGDGTFIELPERQLDGEPGSPQLLHLDGDGHLDLALLINDTDEVMILPGLGDGTFGDPVQEPAAYSPWRLAAGDIDRDGNEDLVCTGDESRDLCVLMGDGQGGLAPRIHQATHSRPVALELFDLDANGYLDVVCSNRARDFYTTEPHLSLHLNLLNNGFLSTGPGPGPENPTLVRLFDLGNPRVLVEEWEAYGAPGYGVNVALGQLDGELGLEVLTGPGPGRIYGPHVRAFHADGSPIGGVSFLAYGTNRFGVNVTCGDLDADGFDEIVTGAGPGEVFGPHVRGWNWDGQGSAEPISGLSWFAYGTPRWGVNVCCGDLDGDGHDEIVTGAGPGAVYGPHVRGWDVDDGTAQAIHGISFMAYGTPKYGVNVACGDIDGDGYDEIVTGAGPGPLFAAHVRGWNWDGGGKAQAIPGVNFFAYDSAWWGATVGCGDLDGDGIDEILTGRGPAPLAPARVRGWNYDGETLAALPGYDHMAYDPGEALFGVKVAAP